MLQGNERHEGFTYPDEEFFYYLCAKDFGWTVTETDEQPAALVSWMVAISSVVEEVKNRAISDKP